MGGYLDMFNYSFNIYSIIASYPETVDGLFIVVIVGLPHQCGRDSVYANILHVLI